MMSAADVPLILVHSRTTASSLIGDLGRPEYSYYFVLREFRPMLERIGAVVEVRDPESEVEPIYRDCIARGVPCVFLDFAPPNHVSVNLECPTVPVFAWEFDALPNEAFNGKPRNDWTRVLRRLGAAITHSGFAVETTRRALGDSFRVTSIPAPLWDRFAAQRQTPRAPRMGTRRLHIDGMVIDSRETDLSPYVRLFEREEDQLPPLPENRLRGHVDLALDGVVYTAIFNPKDGRKNWQDMVQGFCRAFRDDADATLVLKLTHHDEAAMVPSILETMRRNSPFVCRVLLVHGYLDDAAYLQLLEATTYALNTSHGEGQCLPLMEYMSAGIPAIAPRHTAMRDYVDADSAFVVNTWARPGTWPQDPRQAIRTLWQAIDPGSLERAFRDSHRMAHEEPMRYAAMSAAAMQATAGYCALLPNTMKLRTFLHDVLAGHA